MFSRRSWRNFVVAWRKGIIGALATMTACGSVGVQLRGDRVGAAGTQTYSWTLSATTKVDSPQEVTTRLTSLEAIVTMRRSRRADGGRVFIRIDPKRFTDDGLATQQLRTIDLAFSIDDNGTARSIVDETSFSGQTMMGALTAILGQEFLSVLDLTLNIGDEWPSPLSLASERERLDLEGSSRLDGFKVSDRHRAAIVTTERSGDAAIEQMIGRANAEMNGRITQKLRSMLDVDTGTLLASETRSTARFDISILNARQGTVTVTQRSTLRVSGYSSL